MYRADTEEDYYQEAEDLLEISEYSDKLWARNQPSYPTYNNRMMALPRLSPRRLTGLTLDLEAEDSLLVPKDYEILKLVSAIEAMKRMDPELLAENFPDQRLSITALDSMLTPLWNQASPIITRVLSDAQEYKEIMDSHRTPIRAVQEEFYKEREARVEELRNRLNAKIEDIKAEIRENHSQAIRNYTILSEEYKAGRLDPVEAPTLKRLYYELKDLGEAVRARITQLRSEEKLDEGLASLDPTKPPGETRVGVLPEDEHYKLTYLASNIYRGYQELVPLWNLFVSVITTEQEDLLLDEDSEKVIL